MAKLVQTVLVKLMVFAFIPSFLSCKLRQQAQDQSNLRSEELFPKRAVLRSGILENLDSIYFKGQPKVPGVLIDEIQDVQENLSRRRIGSHESKAIDRIFGNNSDLIALSFRDTDNDGINDFRVSHYDGKFFEGDLDLDGDGVVNVADADPFDPNKGNSWSSAQGIPKHLSIHSSSSVDQERLRGIQGELLAEYNVLVVERSISWDLASLEAIIDVFKQVFKSVIGNDGISTLKTLAAEKQVGIVKETDGETNAMIVMANKSLIVYESGLRARPLVKLGLMIHELGHNLQYELDDRLLLADESNKRQYYFQEKFFELMQDFGWRSEGRVPDQSMIFSALIPTYELIRPEFSFQGSTVQAWSNAVNKWSRSNRSFFVESPAAEKHFIVSDYSLTDPFEWLSENTVAYVFSEMEKAIYRLKPGTKKDTIQKLIDRELSRDWPGYSYRKIQNAPHYKLFKDLVPMAEDDVEQLAKKYLIPLFESSLQLTSETEKPNPESRSRSCGRSKKNL